MPRGLALVVVATLATPCLAAAQAPNSRARAFTPNDALDVATWTVTDLSRDGRWLAATSATRRDGLGNDYRRDGDPSYVRPARSRVWVIDTRSGQVTPVFAEQRNVRAGTWSPDGSRLALLVARDSGSSR